MDMMQIRKMVMAQMAGTAKSKSGSFTGDNKITAALDIGFEPDAVIIDSDIDYSASGNSGMISVLLVKGVAMTNIYHNPSTSTTPFSTSSNPVNANEDPWGANKASYANINYPTYATYANGVLTVTNTQNAGRVYFVSGQTYTWTAYKA